MPTDTIFRRAVVLTVCAVLVLKAVPARAEGSWPDLSAPAKAVGGGEHDAAVVVGVEDYFAVPGVPGAKSNAGQWFDYLTVTRGVPPQNVKLLTNADATREEILGAAGKAAGQAGPDGTLWFVFVGHGAPAVDGKDGLLVGVDAQQKAESLQARSVRRGELLKALAASPAGSIRVVLDACFSGRGQDGTTIAPGLQPLLTVSAAGALDPRMAVLTAAKGNQFAGALPGASRPAFSYLVLGGLRGWAAGADGKVTAGSLLSYAKNALAATLHGRDQTPDLIGPESALVAASAGEKGPNLAKLAKATSGGGALQFNVGALPAVGGRGARLPGELAAASGIDFGAVDVEALGKYDGAVKFDKGGSTPESKAAMWKELAEKYPGFKPTADERAKEWERYAAELAATAAAKEKRAELMAKDWAKLSKLLSYSVVGAADKQKAALTFVTAYGKTSEANPYLTELKPYLPAGTLKAAPVAARGEVKVTKDIQWVTIPGGSFEMGTNGESKSEGPAHRVSVKTFQLAKTEVTNGQYKACVKAGACAAPIDYATHAVKYVGGDDHPVVNVDWVQSKKFSVWAGGRLPTEAEWEYAARSGGKKRKYPWGDAEPTCDLAVIQGCGDGTEPVCSKPAGNTQQGLCDMAGNVWEWVQDKYQDTYQGAPIDGSAWISEKRRFVNGQLWECRVIRGCGLDCPGESTRSTWRSDHPLDNLWSEAGFRPARSF
jgi:formylglycine-generating enzyme required for sulfatase activity